MTSTTTSTTAWQVHCLDDVVPTPWRNGGGTTQELVAWPSAAAWRWRASVAEVAQSGPFSSFVGVQRWFAVLQGDGVCLTIDGRAHTLGKRDAPFAFDGAAATTCELLGGATQDFNLMLQGGKSGLMGRMLRVDQHFEMTTNTPKIIAVYAHKSRASVQIDSQMHELMPRTLGWALVDAHTRMGVLGSDVLLMDIDA